MRLCVIGIVVLPVVLDWIAGWLPAARGQAIAPRVSSSQPPLALARQSSRRGACPCTSPVTREPVRDSAAVHSLGAGAARVPGRVLAAASRSAAVDRTVAVNCAVRHNRFRLRTTSSSVAVAVIVWREWSRSLTVK